MSHVERIAGDCRSCVFDRLALGNDVLTADQVRFPQHVCTFLVSYVFLVFYVFS